MCDIMCAKKKAFALWLTIWLSFERRKIFLETILQMLLICVCRFSCSPTVTPSRRCFKTYSIGVISNFRLKGALCCCFLGVFLSRRHQHVFCFSCVQCHPISTTPFSDFIWGLLCIQYIINLFISCIKSAIISIQSYCTNACVRHRGRSLLKMQNKSGPRIYP